MKYSRKKDDNCYLLAKIQSRLFEKASMENIPSAYFAKVFFNSHYCRLFDDLSFLDFYPSEKEIFDYVKANVHMNRGTVLPKEIMSWIGYLLREWAYTYNVWSKQITKKVTLSYLAKVYYPYHSLDIQKAIKMIGSDCGINLNESIDELTLRVLRETQK